MNEESEDKLEPGATTPEYVVDHPAETVTDISSLIREPWRRNVIKIGLAYFIAAQLFGGFVLIAFEVFESPGWLSTAIAILLYAGFPLSLCFTWVMQPSDRETRQIMLGAFSSLIMSTGLLAVVGGIMAIAAQPSGDVTIFIFGGFILFVIGIPLALFGYFGLMRQVRRFKAERPARAHSCISKPEWMSGIAAWKTCIKVAIGLSAIALVGAALVLSFGMPRYTNPGTLVEAASAGNSELVKVRIDQGADLEVRGDADGWTPLIHSVWAFSDRSVRLLIDAGADVNAQMDDDGTPSSGMTALIRAATYPDSEGIVSMLIDAGADVNARLRDGRTALIFAARHASPELVKLLLAAGADVDVQSNNGWSALLRAAQHGRVETVKELLAAGANLSARTKDGDTALILASENGHIAVVKSLKQSGTKH